MRYKELTEMPLDSYDLHGDFSQDGSLSQKDRKLVSSPKHPERLERLLRAGKTKLAINVVNLSPEILRSLGYDTVTDADGGFDLQSLQNVGRARIRGELNSDDLAKLGLDIKSRPDAITGILLGNTLGADALSAWMIIHRITHFVEDASFDAANAVRAGRPLKLNMPLKTAWYKYSSYISEISYKELSRLVTMKSAPTNSEISNEILTQYLVKGRVTLKTTNADEQAIEDNLNQLCAEIERNMLGRVFTGF